MHKILLICAAVLLPLTVTVAQAQNYTMAPDGSYVSGDSYTMTPDGSYVRGHSYQLAPDGSYLGSE